MKANRLYVYLFGILFLLNIGQVFAGGGQGKGREVGGLPVNMELEKDDFYASLNLPTSPNSSCKASIYSVVGECLAKPENRDSNIVKLYNSFIANGKGTLSKDKIESRMKYIDDNLKTIKDVPKIVADLNLINVNTFMFIKTIPGWTKSGQFINVPSLETPNQVLDLTPNIVTKVYSIAGISIPTDAEIHAIIRIENAIKAIIAKTEVSNSLLTPMQLSSKISIAGERLNYDFVEYAGYMQQREIKFSAPDFNYFSSFNKLLGTDLNDIENLKSYFKFKMLYVYFVYSNSAPISWERNEGIKFVVDNLHDDIIRICFMGETTIHKYEINKQRIGDIARNIKEAYNDMISAQSGIKQSTKSNLTKAIEDIKFSIGYPSVDELEKNFTDFALSDNNLAENMLKINLNRVVNKLSKIGKLTSDKERFNVRGLDVNAEYVESDNIKRAIMIPAALFKQPFLNEDNADSYSGIGFIIAHEIGHALDREVLWSDDSEFFENKYNSIQGQYSAITAREAWADNLGLYAAYQAYQSYLEKNIPLKDQKEYIKDFYIDFAQTLAQECPVGGGKYPPIKERINKVLSNQDAFNDVFDLKPGNKMYRLPQERGRIFKPTEKKQEGKE